MLLLIYCLLLLSLCLGALCLILVHDKADLCNYSGHNSLQCLDLRKLFGHDGFRSNVKSSSNGPDKC